LWESFVDDFKTFTKDILNNLGKDQLKRIRDYLCENNVFIQKKARKSIAEGLLVTIYKPNLPKWPTADNSTPNNVTHNNDLIPDTLTPKDAALALPSTATVLTLTPAQIIQAID
jgi:hypothetical protein